MNKLPVVAFRCREVFFCTAGGCLELIAFRYFLGGVFSLSIMG